MLYIFISVQIYVQMTLTWPRK